MWQQGIIWTRTAKDRVDGRTWNLLTSTRKKEKVGKKIVLKSKTKERERERERERVQLVFHLFHQENSLDPPPPLPPSFSLPKK